MLFIERQSAGNQRQYTISQVGTSETICVKSSKYNEWLAGLIYGDGSFLVSKKGYCSLDITMELADRPALDSI